MSASVVPGVGVGTVVDVWRRLHRQGGRWNIDEGMGRAMSSAEPLVRPISLVDTPPRTRPWAAVAAVVTLTVVVSVSLGVTGWLDRLEPRLQQELEAWLSDRLGSDVRLETVDVTLGPRLRVTGRGLTLRIRNRPDLPAFVTIGRWSGTAHLSRLGIRHFDEVRLWDVGITIPPRRLDDLRGPGPHDDRHVRPPTMQIDRLIADRVVLSVMPRDEAREPHVWDIQDLRMDPFSFDLASPFSATVDTPLPDDRAHVTGTAGPWPRGSFHALPLSGEYVLHGRLDRVAGLHGEVAVRGRALGTLDRLSTVGTATSPAVGLTTAAGPGLPLKATYAALFDATDSDVAIEQLAVSAGRASVNATGHVVQARGAPGRHVALRLTSRDTDVADLLRLVVDGARPPASGRVGLDATFDLPAGRTDVMTRARVQGRFDLRSARFLNPQVQQALDDMSRRGRGQPDDPAARVPSRVSGAVTIRNGRLSFASAALEVPGARVEGGGVYSLVDQSLDFHGITRLDARLAQTQRGFKRFLLWPVSPLFARDGAGTRVVLDVRGTRSAPVVDVDLGASLRGRR